MPYIGTQPLTGQFKKLDTISVVNGQAAYTLNYNSAAYKPATANALLVSVNGVIQAAGDAYTISGSTITFTENLVTGDVIDFIIALGDTGSAVTPVDGSVTTAKLGDDSVTKAKIGTTELDLATIKDSTGNTTAITIDSSGRVLKPVIPFAFVGFPGTDSYVAKTANAVVDFSHAFENDGNHYDTSTYKFTCPVAGLYRVELSTLSENANEVAAWTWYRETGGSGTLVGRVYTGNRSVSGSMTIKCSANDKLYLTQNNNISYYQTTSNPYNWATYTFIG